MSEYNNTIYSPGTQYLCSQKRLPIYTIHYGPFHQKLIRNKLNHLIFFGMQKIIFFRSPIVLCLLIEKYQIKNLPPPILTQL